MFKKTSFYTQTVLLMSSIFSLSACVSNLSLSPVQVDTGSQWVSACVDWDDWDKPAPPFRIYGNSYYVGTCGISSILITSDDGHILIDSGTHTGADVVADNIQSLGFDISEVKTLLHSHEHHDHVGGIAKLKRLSGAKVLASPEAEPVLSSGFISDIDPQAGTHEPFPPVDVDGIVNSGESVDIGSLSLMPISTPGHTHGALSWQWQSCENNKCLSIVYADSLSPISNDTYHFSEHSEYLNAYKAGLIKVSKLDCGILIAPHPSASQMRDKLLAKQQGLIDYQACENYADAVSKRLDKRLIKEQKENM